MLRCVQLAVGGRNHTSEKQEMLSSASVSLVQETKPCYLDTSVS